MEHYGQPLEDFALTGHIEIDAELLAASGFSPRKVEQLLAANSVRELMTHYSFPLNLTLDSAEWLLQGRWDALRGVGDEPDLVA